MAFADCDTPSLILITHQFLASEPLCVADSGGGTLRGLD